MESLGERYGSDLEAELELALGQRTDGLYAMMRYHLGGQGPGAGGGGEAAELGRGVPGRGKALRPYLCLLTCQAAGGDWHRALPAASAVEFTHNFSLIHDDIQDASSQRRHRPTVWRLWGVAQAITAGDALWALALQCLHRLEAVGVPQERVLAACSLLDEACLRLCEGQYLDICFQEQPQVTEADYLDMIAKKTAALMAASVKLGALVAGASLELVAALGEFGHRLGLAFQVRDDILGIWGSPEATGKAEEDLAQGKKTLPVLFALGTDAAPALRPLFRSGGPTAAEVSQAWQALEAVGARQYAQGVASRYLQEAQAILEPLALVTAAREELAQVAAFLVEREY